MSKATLAALTILSLGLSGLALGTVLSMGRRLRDVRRSYSLRHRGSPPGSVEGGSSRWDTSGELSELRSAVIHSLRNIGLVRFDAFEDMGGRLSFAVALLDEEGSGIVLSSINGRNETRVYAKPVDQGESPINLSEEEAEAIRRALAGVRG